MRPGGVFVHGSLAYGPVAISCIHVVHQLLVGLGHVYRQVFDEHTLVGALLYFQLVFDVLC